MFDTSSWSSHSLVMHTNILACEPFSTCVWRVCGGRCLLQQTLEAAGRICQISLTTDRRVIVDQSYKSIATRPECSSYWRLFPRSAVKLKWKHMCVCECVWVSVCVCECGVWRVFLCFMTGSNCIYCSVMSEAEKHCSNMSHDTSLTVICFIADPHKITFISALSVVWKGGQLPTIPCWLPLMCLCNRDNWFAKMMHCFKAFITPHAGQNGVNAEKSQLKHA